MSKHSRRKALSFGVNRPRFSFPFLCSGAERPWGRDPSPGSLRVAAEGWVWRGDLGESWGRSESQGGEVPGTERQPMGLPRGTTAFAGIAWSLPPSLHWGLGNKGPPTGPAQLTWNETVGMCAQKAFPSLGD